jgi:small subunit ribosomal protein S16
MLSIRLSRTGKVHAPHYRIVVQEKRSKLNGKTVDTIGHYHPASKDKLLVIDHEKATKWLSLGAQASDTVTNLLVKEGLLDKSKKVSNFFTPVAKPVVEEKTAAIEAPVAEEAATEEVSTAETTEEVVAETTTEE